MGTEGGLRRRVKGLSEVEFRQRYGTEAQCRAALFQFALGGRRAAAPVIGIGGGLAAAPSHTTVHTGPYTAVRRIKQSSGPMVVGRARPASCWTGRCSGPGWLRSARGRARWTRSAPRADVARPLVELIEPVPAVPPRYPGDRTQPSPDPLLKHAQDRQGLAVAEAAEPTDQVGPEILDHLRKADAPCPPRQLPDPLLEPGQGLRRDPPPGWLRPRGEAEA